MRIIEENKRRCVEAWAVETWGSKLSRSGGKTNIDMSQTGRYRNGAAFIRYRYPALALELSVLKPSR